MTFDPETAPLFILAAMLYGIDKSFAPGASMLAVAFLAGAIPARSASGITLLMAIAADWCAIWAYRKTVSFGTIVRLFPFVAIGVVCGVGFLFVADDLMMKRTIGVILAVYVGSYIIKRLKGRSATPSADADEAGAKSPTQDAGGADKSTDALALPKRVICGALAGFTSMVANAAGPVTAIYFLSENLPVMTFLGTPAWFYLILNLVKLPFSIGLGMITLDGFSSMIWTLPVTLLTVLVGRQLAKRVSQNVFTTIIYLLSVVAIIRLFL